MGSKKYAKEGIYSNDVSKEINQVAHKRNRRTIQWNDAWRKAKELDPTLEFRMSFVNFKRGGRKNLDLAKAPRKKF
jgi:hypothetical protein